MTTLSKFLTVTVKIFDSFFWQWKNFWQSDFFLISLKTYFVLVQTLLKPKWVLVVTFWWWRPFLSTRTPREIVIFQNHFWQCTNCQNFGTSSKKTFFQLSLHRWIKLVKVTTLSKGDVLKYISVILFFHCQNCQICQKTRQLSEPISNWVDLQTLVFGT